MLALLPAEQELRVVSVLHQLRHLPLLRPFPLLRLLPPLPLLPLKLSVLHVEDGTHVLLQVVVVPVPFLAEGTLYRVIPRIEGHCTVYRTIPRIEGHCTGLYLEQRDTVQDYT